MFTSDERGSRSIWEGDGNLLDSRDIEARIVYLATPPDDEEAEDEEKDELSLLLDLRGECLGAGFSQAQWDDGLTLVRDEYFPTHAQELAEDLSDARLYHWPFCCIDWEDATEQLKGDYVAVRFDNTTYWVRD